MLDVATEDCCGQGLSVAQVRMFIRKNATKKVKARIG